MNSKSRILAISLPAIMATTIPAAAQTVSFAWEDFYHGPADYNDFAQGLTTDDQGNAYMIGLTYITPEPNLYVPAFLTVKFDPAGKRLWEDIHSPGFSSNVPSHVLVAPNGDVIVAGTANLAQDWAVVRYSADGDLLWSTVIGTSSSFLTSPYDLYVDQAGASYVTGFTGGASVVVARVAKVSPKGDIEFNNIWAGPEGAGASGRALYVDAQFNVYLAGNANIDGQSVDAALVKFDSTGTVDWHVTYNGEDFAVDRADDLAADSAGNLLAAGVVNFNGFDDSDLLLLKVDPEGAIVWDRVFNSKLGNDEQTVALALDSADNAVITGVTETSSFNNDVLTVKYDAAGELIWSREFAGADLVDDVPYGLRIGDADDIYIAGQMDPANLGEVAFTVRYSPDGELVWEQFYGAFEGDFTHAEDLAIGVDGDVFVTGDTPGLSGTTDIFTLKYTQSGSTKTPADLDNDGVVGPADLAMILAAWGACDQAGPCNEDIDGDGIVGPADLATLLANWD